MCQFEEESDLDGTYCTLDGKKCQYEDDMPDCIAFDPSEYDVMNGFYSDDPEGLAMWRKRRKGISCKTCKHQGDQGPFGWCASCYAYELYDKKKR